MNHFTDMHPAMAGFLAAHQAILNNLSKFESHVTDLPEVDRKKATKLFQWFNYIWPLIEQHHLDEDKHFFPMLAERAVEFRRDLAELTAEHQTMDILAELIQQDFTDLAFVTRSEEKLVLEPRLKKHLAQFQVVMTSHLQDEEAMVLAAVARHYTEADQSAIEENIRKTFSPEFLVRMVPWMLDGLDNETGSRFLSGLPTSLQEVYRLAWKPQYDRQFADWVS